MPVEQFVMIAVGNMEMYRRNGSKKFNFIVFLALFNVFTTVTCNLQHINQDFFPWPLKVERHRRANEVCGTAGCQDAAELIKQSMNASADPCDDFYEFACGGWVSKHPVLPTEPQRSQFSLVGDRVEAEVKEILEAPIDPNDPGPVKDAKKYFISCKDTDHIEEEGLDPLFDIIDDLGGWPLATDDWDDENFNWQTAVAKILKGIATPPLITLYTYKDQKNSSRNILINDQSSLSFPRQMLTDSETYKSQLDAYRTLIVGLATELAEAQNLIIPPSDIAAQVDELIKFEIKLAEITIPKEQRRDPYRMYNLKTLRELQSLTDSVDITHDYARIDWMLIVNTIFDGLDITFTPDEPIIVKEVDFLPELVKLLDSTPIRVIANYVNLQVVKSLSSYTTKKMRDLGFEFSKTFSGATEQSPRWQQCISDTSSEFGMAVGYVYVKKFFDAESRKAARNMVHGIQSQFSSSINDLQWMDAPTKRVAKEKAEEMEENIGYPNWFSNSSALDEYYKGVSIGESYIANHLSLTVTMGNLWLIKLRKPADRSEWLTSPQEVNAFYNPQDNSIILPAGILQAPFFNSDRPKALNYGGMGAVIGHEITHGFDDTGRKSDKHGNLAQWWSQETIDTYVEKTKCFVEQYGSFRIPELDAILHTEAKMSGVRTQGENIADNGGLRQSFFAYKKYVDKHGPEKRLPGLEEYSPEKLFFLSFATSWCTTSTLQVTLRLALTDSHSLAKYRVIGTLSNMEQFTELWQCPAGSRMNPTKKCKIW